MDIFNKKRIKELESKIQILESKVKEIEAKPKSCFEMGEIMPENSYLSLCSKYLNAIIDYLKIEIKWHWEDDPSFDKPMPKQIRVWRAEKRK